MSVTEGLAESVALADQVDHSDLEATVLALLQPKRHAGGRPMGVRNSGPSSLERAVVALDVLRSKISPEAVAESEFRVSRFMTKRWAWMSRKVRAGMIAAGIPKEELDVVVAYKRSEDRVGMSRVQRFKAGPRGIGAGPEDEIEPDEVTEKEAAGKVRRDGKPRKRRVSLGYLVDMEAGMESLSLDDGDLSDLPDGPAATLWGVDVSQAVAMQEQEAIEREWLDPVRARSSKRSWLAPVNATQEFTIGRWVVVGAGDGTNGRVGYGTDPTIGECHAAELEASPVRGGLEYEPDGRGCHVEVQHVQYEAKVSRVTGEQELVVGWLGDRIVARIDVACVEAKKVAEKDVVVVSSQYRAPLAGFIELRCKRPLGDKLTRHYGVPRVRGPLPRTAGESKTGLLETRWRKDPKNDLNAVVAQFLAGKQGDREVKAARKAIKAARKWWKPDGAFVQQPVEVDKDAFVAAETILAAGRRANDPGLFWDCGNGAFVPLWAVKRPKSTTVYHTTSRSVLTPQIKAAVLAVYGRPLPRSPLLKGGRR